jgi:hypothetical protein
VYAKSIDGMHAAVERLAGVLGMERPLNNVTIHSAAGQR